MTITLIPLAMIVPNRKGIYAPSRIEQPRQVTAKTFITRYADSPRAVLVSFEQDGVSNPQPVTAYAGGGMD